MNHRMMRVLTCLGMISALLLTMTSTGFISNGYQKVYAAADFPTLDFGTKIREWINNQIRQELSPLSSPTTSVSVVKITLSGFPHQTGESVTNVQLVCVDVGGCSGKPTIIEIPGIGKDSSVAEVLFRPIGTEIFVTITDLPGQTGPSVTDFSLTTSPVATKTIDIPGIGTGQARVQLVP
jgi:hypothetical protein